MCNGQITLTTKAIPVELMGVGFPKFRSLLNNAALTEQNVYACITVHTELLAMIHILDKKLGTNLVLKMAASWLEIMGHDFE